METLAVLWLAFACDCMLGDPKSKLHPVIMMGNLIAFVEKLLLRERQSNQMKLCAGFFLVLIVLTCTYLTLDIVYFIVTKYVESSSSFLWILTAILFSMTISPRSLAAAGREICQYLESGDLAKARFKVGWIVGRDTDKLTVPEVTRATVETIAENIVDGITSPLFYFFIGGLPLAMLYRAANTMDSMVGYKNDKYLYFGRAAARLDDILNFIPARLTGLLLVFLAFLLRFDWRGAWSMMLRDAKKHPSPNGGYTEATVAGALGIRLGGLNYYFGKPSFRAYMGEPLAELGPIHIRRTIMLMYAATLAFLVLESFWIIVKGGFLL